MVSLLQTSPPTSALVVAAHPDDIEFYAGGTLAAWTRSGTQAHYLLVTDGASGSRDPSWTSAALAEQRRAEQRRAAATLEIASVTFLGYPDAGFDPTLALRLAIARVIRQVRPDVVLTFDPQRLYHSMGINHTDHVIVGASTLGAVMPLANTLLAAPALCAEGLAPHDVARVYLFETAAATHWMPLTDRDVTRKLAALQQHASQLRAWDGITAAQRHMAQLAQAASAQGISCAQAEAFTCIELNAHAAIAEPPRLTGIPRQQRIVRTAAPSVLARVAAARSEQ